MSFYGHLRVIAGTAAGIVAIAGGVLAIGVNYKAGTDGLRELLGISVRPPPISPPVVELPPPPKPKPVDVAPSYSIGGQWHWRADCGIAGAWNGSFQFDEPSKNTFKGTVTANIAEPGIGRLLFGACPPPLKIRDGHLKADTVSFIKEGCGGERPQSWTGTIVRGSDDLLLMSGMAIVDSSKYIPQRDWQCSWTASQSSIAKAGASAKE